MIDVGALESIERHHPAPPFVPEQTPLTILDFERLDHRKACGIDMRTPMADPCPNCGAFRLDVGCWVCVGACNVCWDEGYGST